MTYNTVKADILKISSQYQTKKWRNNQLWYGNGKRNECEKYQISVMKTVFDTIEHTNDRINLDSGEIRSVIYPFKQSDAFEWTENFDGKTI